MAITELERIAEEFAKEGHLDLSELCTEPTTTEHTRQIRQTEKGVNDFFLQYSKDFSKGNYELEHIKDEQITLSNSSYLLTVSAISGEDNYKLEIIPKRIFHGVNIARSSCSYGQDFDSCKSINLMLPKDCEGHAAMKKLVQHVFELSQNQSIY